jgi:beta-N-acetylhexosaminidase
MGGVTTHYGQVALSDAIDGVARGYVGSVNFLGTYSGLYADGQLALVNEASGDIPPFLAADEEGGRVQRLEDTIGYVPSAREMANTMTPAEVKKEARRIGQQMSALSLNMNLAPVVDVSSQSTYEVIGDRSYGDTPAQVTRYAGAFAEGMRQAGIVPVLKHFPGLGTGTGNTDEESAQTAPLDQLRKTEFLPYQTLLKESPVAVMTTNAVVPGLSQGEPASLASPTYKLLREEFDFDGVIMTDSLSALAILNNRSLAEAVEQAIVAGADMAIWDEMRQAQELQQTLTKAVRQDRLPEAQVNKSVERVLALKGVDLCGSP